MPYVEPTKIQQVKRVDLLTYLQNTDPDELVRLSNDTYCLKSHDSLKISHGLWYWWSRGFGGKNALDYLIKVKEHSFLKAVELLTQSPAVPFKARKVGTKIGNKTLILPLPSKTTSEAESYLRLRGIDGYVIRECIKAGLIYGNTKANKHNVVFIGKDPYGKPRYGSIRGCGTDFKGEASGSDKHYSFRLLSRIKSDTVHVFESAIDALSYATLLLENDQDWRDENLLSLGGTPPQANHEKHTKLPRALAQYLVDNPQTKYVILHLDNDEPGIAASNSIATALTSRGYDVNISLPVKGKDINEYLLIRRNMELNRDIKNMGAMR